MDSIKQAVSFEVDVPRRPASPTKPAVQARLEGWKSPSPTKENIENRLASANEARSAHLTAPIEKNNRRFEKVQVNKSILGENEKMTLGQKKEEICNKLETAEKKVESMTKERVEKVAGHNIKVTNAMQSVSQMQTAKKTEIKENFEKKMNAAEKQVETITKEKVGKVADHNSKVATAKQSVSQMEIAKQEDLKEDLKKKMEVASSNFEHNMAEKILKSAVHNDEVKVKHVRVRSEEQMKKDELASTLNDKMAKASQAKHAMITDTVMKAGHATREKMEKGKQAMAATEARAAELENALAAKMGQVTTKREEIIKEKIQKSAVKKVSPKSATSPRHTATSLNAKLDDAAARRDSLLMQRAEQCAHATRESTEKGKQAMSTPGRSREAQPKKLHSESDVISPPVALAFEEEVAKEEVAKSEPTVMDNQEKAEKEKGGCVIN